ncbi:MAG: response regulator, partial [Candidatus Moranbacteria bacterium CG23_combo_of_CG06-09_8_20_14_all_39_10]
VEDEDSLRKALAEKFLAEKFEVLEAVNGEDGLVSIEKNSPDLVLLDIIMPIMDGMTMLKELRKTKFGKDVPVIILTNSNNDDSLSESLASGAYDFLIKSNWKIQEVVDKVKERLGA